MMQDEQNTNAPPPENTVPASFIPPKIRKPKINLIWFVLLLTIIPVLIAITFLITKKLYEDGKDVTTIIEDISPFGALISNAFKVEKFSSEEEYKEYIQTYSGYGYGFSSSLSGASVDDVSVTLESVQETGLGSGSKMFPSRTSSTNVQVQGIDEPDIVKASGRHIFTSFRTTSQNNYEPEINSRSDRISISPPPKPTKAETNIINAFPPEDMEKIGDINQIGNLLYVDDILIIFTDDTVFAYDVSTPSSPDELWSIPYTEETRYHTARLYGDDIYLITKTVMNWSSPCPIEPILLNDDNYEIACTNVYHPVIKIPTNVTYTVFKIDAKSGDIKSDISFVGSDYNSVIYMSENSIYLTYTYEEDFLKMYLDFITTEASEIFPESFLASLTELNSYNISDDAKMVELEMRMAIYVNSLSEDEMQKIEDGLDVKMDEYTKEHIRDFQSTGIIKLKNKNLSIEATGIVPGSPLNQFSLDEYENNLRIATNSGDTFGFGSQNDVNDVYILNNRLNLLGSVKDLGKDERIYSARFIGDRGYVVTFREIDPFYILDLSDPRNPEMTGELKIPGYSSYLHPLGKHTILGIGKEDSKVKLSLFDVSNPEEADELDKVSLNEYWSEAVNNHHAFLQDNKHEVFFVPGKSSGYIYSYENGKLGLIRKDNYTNVKRAVFMDDYLYIISQEEIKVFDEKNWKTVKEYNF